MVFVFGYISKMVCYIKTFYFCVYIVFKKYVLFQYICDFSAYIRLFRTSFSISSLFFFYYFFFHLTYKIKISFFLFRLPAYIVVFPFWALKYGPYYVL